MNWTSSINFLTFRMAIAYYYSTYFRFGSCLPVKSRFLREAKSLRIHCIFPVNSGYGFSSILWDIKTPAHLRHCRGHRRLNHGTYAPLWFRYARPPPPTPHPLGREFQITGALYALQLNTAWHAVIAGMVKPLRVGVSKMCFKGLCALIS